MAETDKSKEIQNANFTPEAMKAMAAEVWKEIQPEFHKELKAIKDNGMAGGDIQGKSEVVWYQKTIGNIVQDRFPIYKGLSPDLKSWVGELKQMFFERKAQSEGSDKYGGFTVNDELAAGIVEAVYDRSTIMPLCDVRRTTKETYKINRLKQSLDPASTLSLFGGVEFTYLDEAGTIGETQAEFEQITLILHKIGAIILNSSELLSDSEINIVNYLTNLMRRALAYLYDYNILSGSGLGRPLGILTDTGILHVHRATLNDVQLVDCKSVDAGLLEVFNPIWLMRKANWLELVDEASGKEAGGVIIDTRGRTILGYPMIQNLHSPAKGTSGDITLADMSNYVFTLGEDFRMDSSIHYKFATDQPALRFISRFNGQLTIPQGVVQLHSATS